MRYQVITVGIATFNSEQTLSKTLKSIKKQSYPQTKIEILIIDGGSVDKTLEIAQQFKARIIKNSKTELIYAKYIAFYKAKGKYLVYLDSDEVLESSDSLIKKYRIFQVNKKIRSVFLGGYKTLPSFAPINNYINEFGDPFSFFIYRESKGDQFLVRNFMNKYHNQIVYDDYEKVVINFNKVDPLPLVELWAGGSMIDLEYSKKTFPQIRENPGLIAHLFYLLNKEGTYLAISKKDYTIHNSVVGVEKYLKKIRSRISNNIYNTPMGEGGFIGRDKFQKKPFIRFLFIPYTLSIIFPLIDSVYLCWTRRRKVYLIHVVLCIYSCLYIVYYFISKKLHIKPKMKTYGN